ncbi:hypothetical protein QS257_17995 [Terrilactibacillus sp. S3-3]|nr:hypothetical protein QS257_17995 [Terrilactibacillus sp. S3-3]
MTKANNFKVNEDEFLNDLFSLLSIPSVKNVDDAREEAPFGLEVDRALKK